jgi:hypothetical protein
MLLSDAMVDGEGEQEATISETIARDLVELSRRTGIVFRCQDSAAVKALFAELEKYDSRERAETFDYLKNALSETRASLGSEPCYKDE